MLIPEPYFEIFGWKIANTVAVRLLRISFRMGLYQGKGAG